MLSTPSRQRLARLSENVAVAVTEGASTEQLVEVYSDPFVARIAHDHRKHYPVFSPAATYLSAWVDGQFAGLYLAIKASEIELDVHVLLKKKATRHSRALGAAFLAWCFSNPMIRRLTGYIPDWIPAARNHSEKMGFKYEGVRRHAHIKDGQPRGLWIMGLLREEWEAHSWAV